jgi:quercetin dioxygenase-like cupin family protein
MNQGHVQSGEVINLEKLKGNMDVDASYALVKTEDMEVIRMALPKGKVTDEHSVEGEISVQCLKGAILFNVGGHAHELTEDDWLYLEKQQKYSYSVKKNTILLVTILFTDNSS